MSGNNAAWLVIGIGVLIVFVGVIWLLLPNFPLGRLPGDIAIERGNTRVYFPIVTCIVLSVLLSLIFSIIRWLSR